MVKELRDQTGAGMMDCKAALSESAGNLEAAVDWLRKKGLSKAAKKAAAAASSQKATSGTEGSEEVSSSLGDSEEGSVLKVRPAYVSSNSFANLDS